MKNFKELLHLDQQKFLVIVVAIVLSIIGHNVVSGLFGFEEGYFFILAVFVLPFYFLVALVYTVFQSSRRKSD